jgi:two-component system, LytTR family, sensor kinase
MNSLFHLSRINLRSFWFFQIIGWLLLYAGEMLSSTIVQKYAYTIITLDALIRFTMTTLLRYVYKIVHHSKPSFLFLFGAIVFGSSIGTALNNFIFTIVEFAIEGPAVASPSLTLEVILYWFRINFLMFFGWSTLYFGIKYWMDWDEQKEKLEKAQGMNDRARFQMFRYRLNPHFLFNTLNTIRALIGENTPQAKQLITSLSEFLRYSLMSKNETEVFLKDEIRAIRNYTSIEKVQYENRVDFDFHIDPGTENLLIPSFLIQPLVENDISLGHQTCDDNRTIEIRTVLNGRNLQIRISSNGATNEINSIASHGTAESKPEVENIRAQLERMFPDNHRYRSSCSDGYRHTIIEIPARLA